jgi:hypothetical protein
MPEPVPAFSPAQPTPQAGMPSFAVVSPVKQRIHTLYSLFISMRMFV